MVIRACIIVNKELRARIYLPHYFSASSICEFRFFSNHSKKLLKLLLGVKAIEEKKIFQRS